MLEPTREWGSAETERGATPTSRRNVHAQFDMALEHIRETSEAFDCGRASLADLEEAVADLALVARSCGMLPEKLIIALKRACAPLFASRDQFVVASDDVRPRLVKRAIEAFFGE